MCLCEEIGVTSMLRLIHSVLGEDVADLRLELEVKINAVEAN